MNALSETVGGLLVLGGAAIALAAAWVGYRLADAHARQLADARERYGSQRLS